MYTCIHTDVYIYVYIYIHIYIYVQRLYVYIYIYIQRNKMSGLHRRITRIWSGPYGPGPSGLGPYGPGPYGKFFCMFPPAPGPKQ